MTPELAAAVVANGISRKRGAFSPFTYSIGLEADVSTLLEHADELEYPFPADVTAEQTERFAQVLTFFHEATHLGQFISTSFGLRTLRASLIAIRYLSALTHLEPPLLARIARLDRPTEMESKALNRFLFFLDTLDQLRVHLAGRIRPSDMPTDFNGIWWEPWSPAMYVLAGLGHEEAITIARRSGEPVHLIPHAIIANENRADQVAINAATLMEGYALLAEYNQVLNAFGPSGLKSFQALPQSLEYWGIIKVLLVTLGRSKDLIGVGMICIDLALMYDTFVLYEVPTLQRMGPGELGYPYPGEIFVRACQAAKDLAPLRSHEPEESIRFYRELCAAMKLPAPSWMAHTAHETAQSVLEGTPNSDNAFMADALRVHTRALNLRRKNPERFPLELSTRSGIGDLLDIAKESVTVFNLADRTAHHFHPKNFDLATCYGLIQQLLASDSVECPLRQGNPFFCDSAGQPPSIYCSYRVAGREPNREYDCPRETLTGLLFKNRDSELS